MTRIPIETVPVGGGQRDGGAVEDFLQTGGLGGAGNQLDVGGMAQDPCRCHAGRGDTIGGGQFVERVVECGEIIPVADKNALKEAVHEGGPCLHRDVV